MNKKLFNVLKKFTDNQQKLADKYECEISISAPGMKKVVIANGRKRASHT